MLYTIIKDIPTLTQPLENFNFEAPQVEVNQFCKDLITTMYHYKGLGLAANQVGYKFKAFAIRGAEQDLVIFNPKIVMYSNELVELAEGCLSFPNLVMKIERPQHIRVRYANHLGEINTNTYTGLTARTVQHEMTHLESKVFFQGTSRIKLNKAIKEAKKLGTNYEGKGLLKYAKD